ncbi:hypothetical protein [Nocardioides acrostichi]|uniref:Uncharacterized protein n=1 Tax=Nocardioides acrostichi TaxID=2784339 RepID=A0A930YC25_9ACTN|nr:hypothetical protein [Nocardioides acrostichi]MBF4161064.1 hypothetical protein [Nocardioides acrostichi]
MSLTHDEANSALEAYFGPDLFTTEPTWSAVLLDQVTGMYDSGEELRDGLDLMNLRVEAGAPR